MPGRRRDVIPGLPHHNAQRGIQSIRILEYIESHLLPFVCKKEQIATVESRTKAGGRVGHPPFPGGRVGRPPFRVLMPWQRMYAGLTACDSV